jgi:sugar phosphate isomerase/epimerase
MGRMMRRREALALLGAFAASRSAFAELRGGRIDPIGLQLYTVRQAMEADVDSTLARVAAIGYREVEFAGYFGRTPQQVSDSLRHSGLTAPSAHVPLDATGAGWEGVLEHAHRIGHRYLVVASVDGLTTIDDYRRIAERFNRAGETASKAGIRFGYHNHDFEFTPVEGKLPYDVLLESTDSKHVCFEMDLYWIVKGGQDPLKYFARWPGRIELVHVKDAAGPPGRQMMDVGAGTIDWRGIFARGKQAGIKHCFVEHDAARDPFASIAASFAYLEDLRF